MWCVLSQPEPLSNAALARGCLATALRYGPTQGAKYWTRGAAVIPLWQPARLLRLLSLPRQLLGNLRHTSGISRATEIRIRPGEPQERCGARRDTLIGVPSLALCSVRAWAVG